ncbi:hypothetical protein BC829DRAFT_401242 [Chytridium lagenaria]|nr:hypothetical protein BC829DRAFT_401242 [Chytridium lagenaria]
MTARTNGLKSVTFHHGETYLQQSVDFREQAEAMYTSFIRPAMPQQHQTFYANLPYMIMGSIDSHGRPWASFLTGPPGFITSPDARHLKLTSTQVGFLGIEFPTRRRNRVNGRIQKAVRKERGFEVGVKVVQSFGNCPKYIQAREIVGERKVVEKERVVDEGGVRGEVVGDCGEHGYDFCGYEVHQEGRVVNGGKAIAWPDYKGKYVHLLINDAASTYFPGPFKPSSPTINEKLIPVTLLGVQKEAENLATFTFEVKDGITYTPGQHVTLDFSKDATAIAKKEWLKKSYNSEVYHNDDLVRTWTLTSCPDVNEDLSFKSATTFTITVKRDPNGMLSTLLHDQYTKHINTTPPQIHLRGLSGSFTIHNANPSLQPPIHPSNNRILFLAGGVGITPVLGVVVVVSVSMGAEVPGTLILGLMEMAGRVEGVGFGESLVEDVGDVKERSVMVCGPPDVGVDKENVFTESFAY